MCHVHVAVFALGCEATYISVIPKIPKKFSSIVWIISSSNMSKTFLA
jgi:hypothetical protein